MHSEGASQETLQLGILISPKRQFFYLLISKVGLLVYLLILQLICCCFTVSPPEGCRNILSICRRLVGETLVKLFPFGKDSPERVLLNDSLVRI